MKSEHAERFNHDSDAAEYDQDVKNERHPIRAGYGELLQWVADKANSKGGSTLDFGSGTGNLSEKLSSFSSLLCVDISENMTEIARKKLKDKTNVSFANADLLEFFEINNEKFDSIVSTYAIHHLTEPEKERFFRKIHSALNAQGLAVFGDLMFENSQERDNLLNKFAETGLSELVDDINDEFFWDLQSAIDTFEKLGCKTETKQFSDLSWGLMVTK